MKRRSFLALLGLAPAAALLPVAAAAEATPFVFEAYSGLKISSAHITDLSVSKLRIAGSHTELGFVEIINAAILVPVYNVRSVGNGT